MKAITEECPLVGLGKTDNGSVWVWKSQFGFIFSTSPEMTGPGWSQVIAISLEEVRYSKLCLRYISGGESIFRIGRWVAVPSRTFSWEEVPEDSPYKVAKVVFWDQEMYNGFLAASGAAGFFRRNTSNPDVYPLSGEIPPETEEFVGEPYLSTIKACC